MGKALYRSYRSRSFDEVIGQEHITETLKNSVAQGTYAHAYLLTGPRGVGKTSVARILAHAVNKAKYPADPAYIDIIEIDAASNRRIDEIRDLRERVNVAPTELKYKVYIIDEVHMLTKEAFNALLKTLEEPPEHVIFILATTDIHKVPDTIVSRCLRFNFKPIQEKDLLKQLKDIAKSEKIAIDDAALDVIASHSGGSFRDGIALLDQLRGASKQISAENARKALGLASRQIVDNILASVQAGNLKKVLHDLGQARDQGATETVLTRQLLNHLQQELLDPHTAATKGDVMLLIEGLLNVETYTDTKTALEIALLKATVVSSGASAENPAPVVSEEITDTSEGISRVDELFIEDPKPAETTKPTKTASKNTDELWVKVLEDLKQKNRGLYSVARMAKVELTDDTLVLEFEFPFHHKKISQDKNKRVVLEAASALEPAISDVRIDQTPPETTKAPADDSIKNINDIFGSSEVLKS